MDKTKTYILMCEKAVEVQELCLDKIPTGDFYYQKQNRSWAYIGVHISKSGIDRKPAPNPITWRIWLPRQDQLCSLSGLSWKEFDRECLKYDTPTKEQAGLKVVIKILDKTTH